jgi:hypothetical protein
MQKAEFGTFPAGLRRALAVAEFAIAGLFLIFGVDGLTTKPTRSRGGGDGIGGGLFAVMAWPFLLSGAALAVSAYMAWRGGRRWWAWQAALPALGAAAILGFFVFALLFFN